MVTPVSSLPRQLSDVHAGVTLQGNKTTSQLRRGEINKIDYLALWTHLSKKGDHI